MRVGSKRPGTGPEQGAAAGHVIELHHALCNIERMMVGQRDHAGPELDALGPLAGCRQEHFRRCDHFPAGGMVLAAPELVIAEPIELLDQIEITAELQHRVLADRVMRGEEGPKFETSHFRRSHGVFSDRFS